MAGELHDMDPVAGISAEDQREIMLQIERVAGENRIEASDDLFTYAPLKSGTLFPVLVNIAGLVLLGAGIWILSFLFADQEEELRSSGQAVTTAESRLIEEIRRETEAALAEREATIAEIQQQLASISDERNALVTDLEERVRQREAALREQFQVELEAERQRLIDLNLSEAEIEARLAEFSRVKEREYDQRLAQFRRRAEEEQQQLAAELDTMEAQFNETLANASAERERLLAESQNRLAELQSNFQAQLQQNQAQLTEAEAQLARLTQQQEQTALVRSQLRGLYSDVDQALEERELAAARSLLSDIRAVLNEDSVLRTPALREQRPVDLFIVDALEALIGFEARFGNPETMSRLQDAARIQQVNELTTEAAAARDTGNETLARELYRQAIDLIPAVSESFAFLGSVERDGDGADRTEAANAIAEPLVQQGRAAVAAADWSQAIDDFTSVIERAPTSRFRTEAVQEIRTAADNLLVDREDRIADLEDQLAVLNADIGELETQLTAGASRQQELTAQLAEAREELAAVEAAAAIAPLTAGELEAAEERIAELEEERARAETRIASLQETISARNVELAATEVELLDALNELAEVQGRLAQAQGVISELNSRIASSGDQGSTALSPEIEAELAELRELASDIAAAQSEYRAYREVADTGSEGVAVLEARLALERFLSATAMGELFPDLSGELGRFDQVFVSSGRENALLDVADLITELSLSESGAEREGVLAAAREQLAQHGAAAAVEELVAELALLVE